MKTAYGIRHQAAGLLPVFFADRPTDAQLSRVNAACERRHGPGHPKTKEPWFLKVIEIPLLSTGDDPVPEKAPAPETEELQAFEASGEGKVTPP